MPMGIPWFVVKPIISHHFAADERLERERGEHVESEAAKLSSASQERLQGHIISYKRAMLTIMLSLGKLFKRFP